MNPREDTEIEENSSRPAPETAPEPAAANPDNVSPPPPRPSAFGAPSQQAFGPWEPSIQPPRFSSFTSGRVMHGGGWNPQGDARTRPMLSFTATRPSQEALLYRYPSAPHIPPSGLSFSGHHPHLLPYGPVVNQHPAGYMYPAPAFSGVQSYVGSIPKKRLPSLVKVSNILCFLVLLFTAPLAIWFSYLLRMSSTVLLAGPISACLALAAVHLRNCCSSDYEGKVKFFNITIVIAGLLALGGSVVIPVIMFGVTCLTSPDQNCTYDKPHGEGFSIALAVVLFFHGVMCILMRFRVLSIVGNDPSSGGMFDSTRNYNIRESLIPGSTAMSGRSMSFTSPAANYHPEWSGLWRPA